MIVHTTTIEVETTERATDVELMTAMGGELGAGNEEETDAVADEGIGLQPRDG